MELIFDAELWEWAGESTWYFLTVPRDLSEQVREEAAATRRGFGSVRVRATVEGTTWSTSLFPSAASGCYLLPVKQAVRRSASLVAGDVVEVELELLDT